MRLSIGLLLASALPLAACGGGRAAVVTSTASDADGASAWEAWRAARREELAGPEGWVTLVALDWLEPGQSTLGSDPSSTFVLPASAPARVGRVVVAADVVRFVADPSVAVTREGAPITEATLGPEDPPLAVGSYRLLLLERGGRRGLRIRDLESPARAELGEIPVYPYDPAMRVRARVRAPEPGRMLSLVNVLGMQVDEPCAALLELTIDGHTVTLAATAADEGGYFVMLRDATAGEETYGAGRYLDVEAADANGETIVDLNRLHTPPCGYTHFATCPLPPHENELAFPIRAGERYSAHE